MNNTFLVGFFFLVIIVVIVGLFSTSDEIKNAITGKAVETSVSQVVIQNYLALSSSNNLSDGINFGTITSLPASDRNATGNYNQSDNATEYYVTVSLDSNVAADFCIKANAPLTSSGADTIGLTNYTWSDNSTFNNDTFPTQADAVVMTTSYVNGSRSVAIGSSNYYRFWLNVSANQDPGSYNNTISLQGVPAGDPCN